MGTPDFSPSRRPALRTATQNLCLVSGVLLLCCIAFLFLSGVPTNPSRSLSLSLNRGRDGTNRGLGRSAWATELLNASGWRNTERVSFQLISQPPIPPFWFAVEDTWHSASFILTHESHHLTWIARRMTSQLNADQRCFVVDIGSNGGFYALAARTLGCSVFAIDAQPRCLARLESAAAVNGFSDGVVTSWSAVGVDVDRTITVGTAKCSGLWDVQDSSRINPKSAATVQVKTRPLMELIANWLPDDAVIALLKIDVEGSEVDVLRSALPLLLARRVRTIYAEVAAGRIARITNRDAVVATFTSMYGAGYSCNGKSLSQLLAALLVTSGGLEQWRCDAK